MDEKVVIQQKPPKSPAVAAILSVIFPGTGALYNGLIAKGVLYILIFAGLISIQEGPGGQPFKALILAGFYFFQVIESINNAKAINLAAAGQKPEDLAKVDFMPQVVPSGSVFWGAVLIVIGFLAILANFDVIAWETLWDFWPVAVIVIGLKLVFDSIARKNGKERK
jgi:ABC-type polysaccharide/polyol phosphate export permease